MSQTPHQPQQARRWVLHVDLDAFLASVELLRRPELAGLPVVVGGRGDPTERAVVSTCSYEARAFGVRSGMPLRIAARKCPDAVFLPVDKPHYEEASERVMTVLRDHPGATVEVVGWDEAYVGLVTADPEREARALQQAVTQTTGLTCSVGIGDTLLRAKTASDFEKPRGVSWLTAETWPTVMGPRPVTELHGVGSRIGTRLEALGITTIAGLAAVDESVLATEFGPTNGPRLRVRGRGEGPTWPDPTPWVPKAHGRETTYQQDLGSREEVAVGLHDLAVRVVEDIRAEGRPCLRVHLKVRFVPFWTVNRSRVLPAPTLDPAVIAETALALFDALEDDRDVRLLGVRAEMTPPQA
ncbi:DNA polymerase IV [Nocardioidaceae bacterium]|nr:DNA polymerase IV [Nocardioidaceae bacterium]